MQWSLLYNWLRLKIKQTLGFLQMHFEEQHFHKFITLAEVSCQLDVVMFHKLVTNFERNELGFFSKLLAPESLY